MADASTTRRKTMSPSRRLRIFEAAGGVCVLCNLKIDGVREPWIAEHMRALGLAGPDDDDNVRPAHKACADAKTKVDVAMIAKAKRNRERHLGIKKPTHPRFQRPSGSKFDWSRGRYVREEQP